MAVAICTHIERHCQSRTTPGPDSSSASRYARISSATASSDRSRRLGVKCESRYARISSATASLGSRCQSDGRAARESLPGSDSGAGPRAQLSMSMVTARGPYGSRGRRGVGSPCQLMRWRSRVESRESRVTARWARVRVRVECESTDRDLTRRTTALYASRDDEIGLPSRISSGGRGGPRSG